MESSAQVEATIRDVVALFTGSRVGDRTATGARSLTRRSVAAASSGSVCVAVGAVGSTVRSSIVP